MVKKPAGGNPAGGASVGGQLAGVGVDAYGGQVVDPTSNVLALVEAESKYQDGMREAEAKYQDGMRVAADKFHTAMRDAEAKRLEGLVRCEGEKSLALSVQRDAFEQQLRDIVNSQRDKTDTLLSNHIVQITTSNAGRIVELEKKGWEGTGRTGGRDTGRSELISWIVAAVIIVGGIITAFVALKP